MQTVPETGSYFDIFMAHLTIQSLIRATSTVVTDIVNKETRSRMMAGIKGKDTKPELILRKLLHSNGFRYRLHVSYISGRPDIVLRRYQAVIFVHGCFWHRHEGCRYATTPATRSEFWQAKFDANVVRDEIVLKRLSDDGWRVAIVWECALRRPTSVLKTGEAVINWLHSRESHLEVGAGGMGE